MEIHPIYLKNNLTRAQTGKHDELLLIGDGNQLSAWQWSDDRKTNTGFVLDCLGDQGQFKARMNAKHLKQIIALWPDESVHVGFQEGEYGDRLTLQAMKTRLSYNLVPCGDVQDDENVSPSSVPWEEVDSAEFLKLIEGLLAHGEARDPRDICQNIQVRDGRAMATDGHHVLNVKIPFESVNSYIHVSSLPIIKKMIDKRKGAGPVKAAFDGGKLWISQEDRIATVQLSEFAEVDKSWADFMETVDKMKQAKGVTVEIQTSDLAAFLKKDKDVMRFDFDSESYVTSENVNNGLGLTRLVPGSIALDGRLTISINPKYLKDFIKSAGEVINIRFTGDSDSMNHAILSSDETWGIIVLIKPKSFKWEPIEVQASEETQTLQTDVAPVPEIELIEVVEPVEVVTVEREEIQPAHDVTTDEPEMNHEPIAVHESNPGETMIQVCPSTARGLIQGHEVNHFHMVSGLNSCDVLQGKFADRANGRINHENAPIRSARSVPLVGSGFI